MKRVKKITVGLVVSLTVIVLFLVAAINLAPLLVDKTTLGSKVRSEVSTLIDGDFDFSTISFSFIPLPHAVLANPQIRIEKELSASAERIEVYPELLKLLTGHITLKTLVVNQPEAMVWISGADNTDNTSRKQSGSIAISQMLPALLKQLSSLSKLYLPVANGTISHGSVSLVYGQATTITFDNLEAELQHADDAITLKATATSNIIRDISATATIHSTRPHSGAHVELSKVKLGALSREVLPDASLRVEGGEADIQFDITLAENKSIDASFSASAPNVRLVQAKQTADIDVQTLSGTVHIDAAAATLVLTELSLGKPSMNLSGSFSLSEVDPRLQMKLEGRAIDINATRSTALALAGSDSVVQALFDIVKDGTIPMLTLSGQGKTFNDLADLDNLVLEAGLTGGEITIPGAGLSLTTVSGDVELTKGVLAAKQVMAQWRKSALKDGTVAIDLAKDPLPLQVKTAITFEAADVPPLLAHFVDDKAFDEELAQIEDLEGSGSAAVSITGDTDQLQVDVSVTGIKLSAAYRRLPFPLKITDGGVSYDGRRVTWTKLSGSVGTSLFSSLSGGLDLKEKKRLTMTSGTTHIVIADMLPWLSSHKATREIAGYYGGGKGLLNVSDMRASGTLQDIHALQFSLTGDLADVTLQHLPIQAGPLKIDSLKFSIDQETAVFSEGRLGMLDGSLSVSGTYRNYLSDNRAGKKAGDRADNKELSVRVAGQLGPQVVGWISGAGHLPQGLKLLPLSIRKGELAYSDQNNHTITAVLALQDHLEVNTEVSFAPDSVEVHKLLLKDNLSKVKLSGSKKDRHLNVSFDGILHESSISEIVDITAQPGAVLEGKAAVVLNLDTPREFSLNGELKAEKFTVPIMPDTPLTFNTLAVIGAPDAITITSANLSLLDSVVDLAGSVNLENPGQPLVSLDVEVDRIDVDMLMKQFGSKGQAGDDKTAAKPLYLPVRGDVRFSAKRFDVQHYSIEPLQLDIRLDNNTINIKLKEASMCGIPLQGSVTVSGPDYGFHLESKAQSQQLNAWLNCLADRHFKAEGTFAFTGVLEGHGTSKELLSSTTGHLEMVVSDGRVYRDIILLNVLKFLNVTQVLTERVSADTMVAKGVDFKQARIQVEVQDGTLQCKELKLDAEEIKLSGTGKMDLLTKRADFTILVAPMTTVSTIFGYMPLFGETLQTITSIPLRLSGSFADMHVLPLAPAAVGSQLRSALSQMAGIPLKVVHLDDYHEAVKGDSR